MKLADIQPRIIRPMGDDRWARQKTERKDFGGFIKRKRPRGNPAPDLVGQKFGRWTVVSCYGYDERLEVMKWRCLCICGNRSIVATGMLKAGKSTSCGCTRSRNGRRSPKNLIHPSVMQQRVCA